MSKNPLISVLILALFAFHAVEIPFDLIQRNARPKHCCCQSIQCQCKHSKGVFCPLQHAQKSTHSLHQNHAPKAQKVEESSSPLWFKPAGCGSHEQKATNPAYSKEFFQQDLSFHSFSQNHEWIISSLAADFNFLSDQRLDQPPRVLTSPLPI